MSDSLVLESPSKTVAATAAPRQGFVALFKALLESLVSAQRKRFEDTEPLLYRFPPL